MKKAAAPAPETVQLATFFLGAQEYALDVMRIKEIIQPLPITAVPRLPAFVEGVVELRGAILPVVDLRKRLDLPAGGKSSKYLIVPVSGSVMALVVDGAGEVMRVLRSDLAPPPSVGGTAAPFFTAVCRRGGRIILVVDIDKLLSAQEKTAIADA